MLLSKRSKDLTGQTYGSLTAVKPAYKKSNMLYWEFNCKCGKAHTARGSIIVHASKRGDSELPSCGCVELSRKTKHGFRKAKDTHPAYKAYRGILNRCYNPKTSTYKWYGAKGVTIHPEWKDSPEAFVKWAIANGYKEGMHIDKDILCDKLDIHPHVYGPETCQWISPKENVGYATDRSNYGSHPNVRLSKDEVSEILELYFSGKETNQSELARMYGLKSPSSIGRLVRIAEKDRG